MRVRAPAKVNLYLRVGLPRADGFHPIVSWMVTVALFDNLVFERSPDGNTVALSCDVPNLACDESNLVVKATKAFLKDLRDSRDGGDAGKDRETRDRRPGLSEGVRVRLEKRIPMGAGLGGGSSDAASTLLALNELWRTQWPVERLAEMAASLGSDVPFFLHGTSAICRGRGELVQPLSPPQARFALLILPDRAMPTAPVYRKFDEMRLGEAASLEAEPPWQEWTKLAARELLPKLVNDLEPAAFAIDPGLGKLRTELEQALGRVVRMSGSGSALFSLYDGHVEAGRDAAKVGRGEGVRTVVCEVAPKADIATRST
jgi:4-diphosphocytidyl-2-C-methyl-D-erythritol kinase